MECLVYKYGVHRTKEGLGQIVWVIVGFIMVTITYPNSKLSISLK